MRTPLSHRWLALAICLHLFLIPSFCQNPCDSPTLAQSCPTACISCSTIDGFSGRLKMDSVGQILPEFCTEWYRNLNYVGFMAASPFIDIEVGVSDCDRCCGLEVGIFRLDNCEIAFLQSDTCNTGMGNNRKFVFHNTIPYEVGGCYYLIMDSNGGSDCKFTFKVINGETGSPNWQNSGEISGPRTICAGFPAKYAIPKLPCGRVHRWWLDGQPLGETQSVELTFPTAGKYQLCSQAFGLCHDIPPTCIEIDVPELPFSEKQFDICRGDTVFVDGFQFFESGTFPITYKNSLGCDSIVFYKINATDGGLSIHRDTICPGDSLFFYGKYLSLPGNYHEPFQNSINGCDSSVYLFLRHFPLSNTFLNETACFGSTFQLAGQNFSAPGNYNIILQDKNGCDSTLHLRLDFREQSFSDTSAQICDGESILFSGQNFSQTGNYTLHFTDQHGCDSIATLHLTVAPIFETQLSVTRCFGETFSLGGQIFDQTGLFPIHFQSQAGCDSTVLLDLKIASEATLQLDATICFGENFSAGGQNFSTAGNFQILTKNANGCDSTIFLKLQILPEAIGTLDTTLCFGEIFNFEGQNFATAGSFKVKLQQPTPHGCDSSVVLNLKYLPEAIGTLDTTLCFGEIFNFEGQNFATAGNFKVKLQQPTPQGCDSSVVLNLKFTEKFESTLPVTLCHGETLTLGGQIFDETGNFEVNFQTAAGCDSVVHLKLTVLPPLSSSFSQTICFGENFEFAGQNFNQTGSFTVNLKNQNGCDSAVTLDLRVLPESKSEISATICYGEKFSLGGQNFGQSGSFSVVFKNQSGCDSIVTLRLTVLPESKSQIFKNMCSGDTFLLGGQQFSESGIFNVILKNAVGCDSFVVLHLIVLPNSKKSISAKICRGEVYHVGNQSFASAGQYEIALTNWLGCDSIVHLDLATKICKFEYDLATDPATCFGTADGSLTFSLTQGNPPVELSIFSVKNKNLIFQQNLLDLPATVLVEPLPAGNFSLILQDFEGLIDTLPIEIRQPDSLWLSLGDDIEVDFGETVTLSPSTNFAIDWLKWEPSTIFKCPDCLPNRTDSLRLSTQIWLTAGDESGCTVSDTILVSVTKETLIFVPNVFAPASGVNHRLQVFGNYMVKNIRHFVVYDRWGEQVFEIENFAPNQLNVGWDGRFRGQEMPVGVYVWWAEIQLLDGSRIFRKGDVLLVR